MKVSDVIKRKRLDGQNYPGYTVQAYGYTVKGFKTTWTVPDAPPEKGAGEEFFFALWNGIQLGNGYPTDGGFFLQCVLAWGDYSAEYIMFNMGIDSSGNFIAGQEVSVEPGTVLTGLITFGSDQNGTPQFTGSFEGYPDLDLSLPAPSKSQNNGLTLIECMEAYTGNDLLKLPPNEFVAMKNITLLGATSNTLNWQVSGTPLPTPSGKNTVIVDPSAVNGEIDFYFH